MQIASGLEYGGKTAQAIEAYKDFGSLLAQNKNAQLAAAGARYGRGRPQARSAGQSARA